MLDREEQKLAAEQEGAADEDMWVPSDLESESEPEEEEDGAKKTDDENDSGGEFSSEGASIKDFLKKLCNSVVPKYLASSFAVEISSLTTRFSA